MIGKCKLGENGSQTVDRSQANAGMFVTILSSAADLLSM
jgi:hypothetical protein